MNGVVTAMFFANIATGGPLMTELVSLVIEHESVEPGTFALESVWALPVEGGYRIRNIRYMPTS